MKYGQDPLLGHRFQAAGRADFLAALLSAAGLTLCSRTAADLRPVQLRLLGTGSWATPLKLCLRDHFGRAPVVAARGRGIFAHR